MILTVLVRKPSLGLQVGQRVEVPCDKDGTPTGLQWRRRLKDAEHDNNCRVLRKATRSQRNASHTHRPNKNPKTIQRA